VASQRLKRGMRGALAATAVAAAAVSLTPATASADPAPANASDALKKYKDLSDQAEKLNDELLKAEEDLKAKQSELDQANVDLTQATQVEDQAKKDEEQFRTQVDQLTEASFQGARFNQLSALLVSNSQQDFLNRMSALGVLASDNNEALDKLSGAVAKADDARKKAADAQGRAKTATDDAAKLSGEKKQRKSDLDTQIKQARAQYNQLSASDLGILSDRGNMSNFAVPAGAAGQALQFALSQRGKMYAWGATGPSTYDCSGLTMKSYASAGVSIPRTSEGQAGAGRPVSRAEVRAGDLIIYNGGSHVGMAVDGSNVVHASTEGQPVKVASLDAPGSIYAIRRIAG
jgi:cell wall-associated NlpC family hydrolase